MQQAGVDAGAKLLRTLSYTAYTLLVRPLRFSSDMIETLTTYATAVCALCRWWLLLCLFDYAGGGGPTRGGVLAVLPLQGSGHVVRRAGRAPHGREALVKPLYHWITQLSPLCIQSFRPYSGYADPRASERYADPPLENS
eukprot:7147523-Pyramimonas_sp.AAC.1